MRGQPGTRGLVMWPKVLLSSSTNADDADSAKLEAKATFQTRASSEKARSTRGRAPVKLNIARYGICNCCRDLDGTFSRDRRRWVHRLASGTCVAGRRPCGSSSG